MPNFTYETVDASFLSSAPVRGVLRQPVSSSANALFACFEDADAWPVWLDAVSEVTWHGEPPYGIGTTRDIRTNGVTVTERFTAWEPGRRMTFHFDAGGLPLFQAFAEDYLIEPRGEDACELVWTYALRGRGVFRVIQQLLGRQFAKGMATSFRQLATYMDDNGTRYR